MWSVKILSLKCSLKNYFLAGLTICWFPSSCSCKSENNIVFDVNIKSVFWLQHKDFLAMLEIHRLWWCIVFVKPDLFPCNFTLIIPHKNALYLPQSRWLVKHIAKLIGKIFRCYKTNWIFNINDNLGLPLLLLHFRNTFLFTHL
jgi:hypothetical protein